MLLTSIVTRITSFLCVCLFCHTRSGGPSRLYNEAIPGCPMKEGVLRVTIPVDNKHCVASVLHAIRGSVIPHNLISCKVDSTTTLSYFNVVGKVMLPLLFFPSSLLGSLSALLVPRVSRTMTGGHRATIGVTIRGVVEVATTINFVFNTVFFISNGRFNLLVCGSDRINALVYHLTPLIPLVCLSDVTSNLLGNLSRRNTAFERSILSSTLHVVLVILLLTHANVGKFLLVVCVDGVLAYLLGTVQLVHFAGIGLDLVHSVFLPTLTSINVTFYLSTLVEELGFPALFCVTTIAILSLMSCTTFLVFSNAMALGRVQGVGWAHIRTQIFLRWFIFSVCGFVVAPCGLFTTPYVDTLGEVFTRGGAIAMTVWGFKCVYVVHVFIRQTGLATGVTAPGASTLASFYLFIQVQLFFTLICEQ